jgi:hypothetical protein
MGKNGLSLLLRNRFQLAKHVPRVPGALGGGNIGRLWGRTAKRLVHSGEVTDAG